MMKVNIGIDITSSLDLHARAVLYFMHVKDGGAVGPKTCMAVRGGGRG